MPLPKMALPPNNLILTNLPNDPFAQIDERDDLRNSRIMYLSSIMYPRRIGRCPHISALHSTAIFVCFYFSCLDECTYMAIRLLRIG